MIKRAFPWAMLALTIVYLASAVYERPDPSDSFQLKQAARLPVVYQGRQKPLDTVARNSLKIISDKQAFRDDEGNKHPAIEWLFDVMARPPVAAEHKVFRIEHDQLLDTLELPERPGSFRYSWVEVAKNWNALVTMVQAAHAKEAAQRDLVDNKAIELGRQVTLYRDLGRMQIPAVVPATKEGEDWLTLSAAARRPDLSPQMAADADAWRKMLAAYAKQDVAAFNEVVGALTASLDERLPDVLGKARHEAFFNHFEPFYWCMVVYVFVFLLVAIGWMAWTGPMNKAALWMALVVLVVHTAALVLRMVLQGRPPVTNLYSSAVFIGWGAVLVALIMERWFKGGLGTATGGVVGFLSLLVAHNLSGDGDTMEMMRAVLDTNFWLATHVTTITLGYSANFMAGFLGMVLIFRGLVTKSLDDGSRKQIGRMIYGIIAFSTFFSFIGTVLGGIWADQSWGRFWGWDPKENGALLIVIWNAMILHARWAGLARERGVAALAVAGNIVTAWSWFGVNMLGVGLHSYGFTEGAAFGLVLFVSSQLLFIAMALVPARKWRSSGQGLGESEPPPPSSA